MAKGNNFQTRLDNQKAQLERNGYSAEVVVRTTPEATDMINLARLWEHVIVTADRRTRGYMSKAPRSDYEKTQKAFHDSVAFMMEKMQEEIDRHKIDLSGTSFVSRIAQRYKLAERSKKAEAEAQAALAAEKAERAAKKKAAAEAKAATAESEGTEAVAQPKKKAAPTTDQVDGL